jgi:hypothetical protein
MLRKEGLRRSGESSWDLVEAGICYRWSGERVLDFRFVVEGWLLFQWSGDVMLCLSVQIMTRLARSTGFR